MSDRNDVKGRCDAAVVGILDLIDGEVRKLRRLSRQKRDVPLRSDVLDAAGVEALCSLARAAASLRRSEPATRGAAPAARDFAVMGDEELSAELLSLRSAN